MKYLSFSGRSLTLWRTRKPVKPLKINKIELNLDRHYAGMVKVSMRNIVLVCQLLSLVAQPCCMHYNGSSFEVISLRDWRTTRFPFCLTAWLQVTQLCLFGFGCPLYNSSTLLRSYMGNFLGKRLVNKFCELFRADRLKTVVWHTDISSLKVMLLSNLILFYWKG